MTRPPAPGPEDRLTGRRKNPVFSEENGFLARYGEAVEWAFVPRNHASFACNFKHVFWLGDLPEGEQVGLPLPLGPRDEFDLQPDLVAVFQGVEVRQDLRPARTNEPVF